MDKELATLAGGCFWCLEAVFDTVEGVTNVQSGYAGGHLRNPTYEQVCSGVTGHAEVVQMVFDPSVIAYRELLEIFFCIHDPTTLNRQGADVGSHYRSAIYTHSNEQIEVAQTMIDEVSARGQWNGAIVTEIQPLEIFFAANAYHKDYYQRNSAQPYCRIVIQPKLSGFRERFRHLVKVVT